MGDLHAESISNFRLRSRSAVALDRRPDSEGEESELKAVTARSLFYSVFLARVGRMGPLLSLSSSYCRLH